MSYAVSHRSATSTVSSRSTSCGVMCPLSSSSGTVSVKVSVPCRRRMSVTGSPWERNSTNSAMPPSWRNFSSTISEAALVADDELEARDDERRLPGAADQALQLEPGVLGEDLPVRPEADPGAGPALGDPLALAGQAGLRGERRAGPVAVEDAGHAALEGQALLRWRPVDVDVHPRRERVDHRQADAVQAAGGDVGPAAELAAGVQLGRDDLDARQPGLGLLVGRDAAAVVVHLDRSVGVQRDLDGCATPARASSTPLSMISQRQCISPRVSVEPMYMPGRLRTASRPSRTRRCAALYVLSAGAATREEPTRDTPGADGGTPAPGRAWSGLAWAPDRYRFRNGSSTLEDNASGEGCDVIDFKSSRT